MEQHESKQYKISQTKGAYSSKKLKPIELPAAIVKKLKTTETPSNVEIKKRIRKSKNEQIVEYCRTNDFSKLEEPLVSHTEWAFIPMRVLRYNSHHDLDKSPIFFPVVPFGGPGANMKIFKEYNNFNQEFIKSFSLENSLDIDVQWLQEQIDYIYNLPKYDLFTMKGYTQYGDVQVNSFLRNVVEWKKTRYMNKDLQSTYDYFPLYFQLDKLMTHTITKHGKLGVYSMFNQPERTRIKLFITRTKNSIPKSSTLGNYIELITNNYYTWDHSDRYIVLVSLWSMMHDFVYGKVIDLFHEDLSRIILNSPPLTKDIYVYRGVRNDFYLKGAKDGLYKNIGYVSTSLDIEKAQFFQRLNQKNDDQECCIQRIRLVKGTKALLMMLVSQYGDEKEVLLNHGSTYKIIKPKVDKFFYNKPYEKAYDICHKDTYKVNVSDIILAN